MFLLGNLFTTSTKKLTFKEFQIKKNRLERLRDYYQEKVDYLSSPKIPPNLAAMACRDVPRNQTNGSRISGPGHIKICLRYYKKRLFETARELKKIL